MIGITERRGFITFTNRLNYPLIPIATNFGSGNTIVKGLEAVTMPFVHPLMSTQEEMSVEEYGGAPLLGVDGVSIICHGNSSPLAIKNAIKVARQIVQEKINEQIKHEIAREKL